MFSGFGIRILVFAAIIASASVFGGCNDYSLAFFQTTPTRHDKAAVGGSTRVMHAGNMQLSNVSIGWGHGHTEVRAAGFVVVGGIYAK